MCWQRFKGCLEGLGAVSSAGEGSDDLVMAVLVGAALVGFVLGIVFLSEPRPTDRYTELYFATHKVSLENYTGPLDFNYSGFVVRGELLGNNFWILGPETNKEVLVFTSDDKETRIEIYQTFRLGDTYLLFADATAVECLFHEYPREVLQFEDVRLRFVIENKMKRDHTYYYKTFLGDTLVDGGEVPVASGQRVSVVSSFPAGTTDNQWTRISVVLDTEQNISFGFRTYR